MEVLDLLKCLQTVSTALLTLLEIGAMKIARATIISFARRECVL